MSQELIIKSLGVSNYLETLAFMHAHIKSDDFQDEVWMLQHPPVFTLGTAADENHVINPKDIPAIEPKFFIENGKWRGLLPGEDGYEDH